MKILFDLEDELVAIECVEISGGDGELRFRGAGHTYGIAGFDEETAKKYVLEAYLNKGINLTGYLTELRD